MPEKAAGLKWFVFLACFLMISGLYPDITENIYAQEQVKAAISKEAAKWELYPGDLSGFTFFSAKEINLSKYGQIDGLYLAYFSDGFILRLSTEGKVLETSYSVNSLYEQENLRWNVKKYSWNEEVYSRLSPRQKYRVNLMRAYGDPFFKAVNLLRENKTEEALKEIDGGLDWLIYSGLGVRIKSTGRDKSPIIEDVFDNSPAAREGLMKGDTIIKVNGETVRGFGWLESLENLIKELRGPEGSAVRLTVVRSGLKKPLEKTVRCGKIIEPEAARLLGLKSLVYSIRDEQEEAERYARMAMSINPQDPWAKISQAVILVKEGKYGEARELLGETKSSLARLVVSLAWAGEGDLDSAAESYRKIPREHLEIEDAFFGYFKNLAQKSLAPYREEKKRQVDLFEAKGQVKEALEEYAALYFISDRAESEEILRKVSVLLKKDNSLMEMPEETRKFFLRGEAMREEGNFSEAIQEYQKALVISPFIPQIYRTMAFCYASLKQYERAIENLKIYLLLYPEAPDAREMKDQIYKWEILQEKKETK